MKFVIYEVWTRSRVMDAPDYNHAIKAGPRAQSDTSMHLCNWHAVAVPNAEVNTDLSTWDDAKCRDYCARCDIDLREAEAEDTLTTEDLRDLILDHHIRQLRG